MHRACLVDDVAAVLEHERVAQHLACCDAAVLVVVEAPTEEVEELRL